MSHLDLTTRRPGRLIVLCGLPGSGKTTIALQLAEHFGALRLCSDEWMASLQIDLYDDIGRARVEALQQDMACDLLDLGMTAIYESGGWTRRERDGLRSRARGLGAAVELRFIDAPLDELWRRLSARNDRPSASTGVISRDDLVRWWQAFERPDPDELSGYDPWLQLE